jgi:hypothetical protein
MRFQSLFASGASVAICMSFAGTAQAVTIGTANDVNCYPFSCAASDGRTVYQQVYSSSGFSGATSFNTISFFDSKFTQNGLMDSATYKVSFSTTPKAVNVLDLNYLNNIGADESLFGTFTLSGVLPSVLSLSGNQFNYDPNAGNLLMTVLISNLTESHGYQSFFQADRTGSVTSRLFGSNSFYAQDRIGLVTQFSNSAKPVPVPAILPGAILAGLYFGRKAMRRKQTSPTVA